MSKLIIIEKDSQVEELIHYCKQTKYACVDWETTGLNYHTDTPLVLGVSFQPGSSWIIPLGHKDSPFKKNYVKVLRKFSKEVVEDWDIVKVAWNLKFEYKWFMRYDTMMKGRLFDAQLAKYCLDEERPHDLETFVANMFPEYAGYKLKFRLSQSDDEGVKLDWKNTDFQDLCRYCGMDADLELRAMILMEPKLIKHGFYSLFRNMLMMITKVLAESEYRGMLVDRKYLEGLIKEYAIKIDDCTKKLRGIPAVLKYEKKFREYHIKQLTESVKLEIATIEEEDAQNAARLIANRELKLKGFAEGKFNNKEKYDGFNFNSPPQLGAFLFKHKFGLRLPIVKYTTDKKTKQETDTPSTDEEVLLELQKKDKSGFMKGLLNLRGLTKLNSTYIVGTHKLLDEHNRVHASFRVNGTVTGRLSCRDPNLQNIPRGSTAADIKRMFIPPPGYLLLELDYSQAELRIIAELSGDKAMIDIFKRNYNIHTATACKMNGGIDQYDKVKKILKIADSMSAKELAEKKNKDYLFWVKEKKKGKTLNFSIVYQQGDEATADDLEVSIAKARRFKAEWFSQFPRVANWIANVKKQARRDEYVYNMFGGKRRLHNINSPNYGLALEAERQAVNAPVQGGSGYFTLLSCIAIREEILKGKFPRDFLQSVTVHDSIQFYTKPEYIHKVVPELIKICDNPETQKYFGFQMKDVFMKVSIEVGNHWADMKDYNQEEDYSKLLVNY